MFVLDAIPEIWETKFKATLSPISIFLRLPSIIATILPFRIYEPSFFFIINFIFLSINLNVSFANAKPPIIPL